MPPAGRFPSAPPNRPIPNENRRALSSISASPGAMRSSCRRHVPGWVDRYDVSSVQRSSNHKLARLFTPHTCGSANRTSWTSSTPPRAIPESGCSPSYIPSCANSRRGRPGNTGIRQTQSGLRSRLLAGSFRPSSSTSRRTTSSPAKLVSTVRQTTTCRRTYGKHSPGAIMTVSFDFYPAAMPTSSA